MAQTWPMRRPDRPLKPLDAAALDRLALRYVERFATTRAKLARYLGDKIRARGWEGAPADPQGIADRMADLGYIDDRAFAEARTRAMTRRGLGRRRVTAALHQAGVAADDAETVAPMIEEGAVSSAIAFARRKRIGPFAADAADRVGVEKHIAALVRAGHGFDLSRRIARMMPGEDAETLLQD